MPTRIHQERVVVQSVAVNAWDCATCGVIFGVTDEYEKRRREDGQSFYCPNGHSQGFGASKSERLQRELDQERQRLEAEKAWTRRQQAELDAERKSHASTKGQLTKTRNRIQAGICPDCNRHFINVERHMTTKHPARRLTQ